MMGDYDCSKATTDLVEVSPPFDPNGGTAWLGVSIMFEMLCIMAKNIDNKS